MILFFFYQKMNYLITFSCRHRLTSFFIASRYFSPLYNINHNMTNFTLKYIGAPKFHSPKLSRIKVSWGHRSSLNALTHYVVISFLFFLLCVNDIELLCERDPIWFSAITNIHDIICEGLWRSTAWHTSTCCMDMDMRFSFFLIKTQR